MILRSAHQNIKLYTHWRNKQRNRSTEDRNWMKKWNIFDVSTFTFPDSITILIAGFSIGGIVPELQVLSGTHFLKSLLFQESLANNCFAIKKCLLLLNSSSESYLLSLNGRRLWLQCQRRLRLINLSTDYLNKCL